MNFHPIKLLQCTHRKSNPGLQHCRQILCHLSHQGSPKVFVTRFCLTLSDPMDGSPTGSSVHGILQTRIMQWVAIPVSEGSPPPTNQTRVSCTAGRFFTIGGTKEACLEKRKYQIISYSDIAEGGRRNAFPGVLNSCLIGIEL